MLTDHACDPLFAQTITAVGNLRHEGIPDERIHLVGDVMYDAALLYGARAEHESRILQRLGLRPKGYVLAAVHRAENTDDPERLRAVFQGLAKAAQSMPVVVPLHPRTRAALERIHMLDEALRLLTLISPVGYYVDMLLLEKHAAVIATDSGGMQKEAFFYRVPCVTLRAETEWIELVDLGWNQVLPDLQSVTVERAILQAVERTGADGCPYGDGHASERICGTLLTRKTAGFYARRQEVHDSR